MLFRSLERELLRLVVVAADEDILVGRGRSEQITTPGVYVDSLLGRCTA